MDLLVCECDYLLLSVRKVHKTLYIFCWNIYQSQIGWFEYNATNKDTVEIICVHDDTERQNIL